MSCARRGKPSFLDFTTGTMPGSVTFTRSTVANYFNSSTNLTSAAINAPRFDYNPSTGASRGLLYEPTATNTFLASNTFNIGNWQLLNSTIAQNAIGIDGTTSAWTFTSTSSTQAGLSIAASSQTQGNGASLSIYVKAGTSSFFYMQINDTTDAAARVTYFNLSNGTIGTQNQVLGSPLNTLTNVVIEAANNGFYRISATNTGSTSGSIYFGQCDADASRSSTVGKTIILTAAQSTTTALSSYITVPTTALTRGADSATFTIAAGVGHLIYTFDDNTQQTVTVSAGSYTIPTTLNRYWIKKIDTAA